MYKLAMPVTPTSAPLAAQTDGRYAKFKMRLLLDQLVCERHAAQQRLNTLATDRTEPPWAQAPDARLLLDRLASEQHAPEQRFDIVELRVRRRADQRVHHRQPRIQRLRLWRTR